MDRLRNNNHLNAILASVLAAAALTSCRAESSERQIAPGNSITSTASVDTSVEMQTACASGRISPKEDALSTMEQVASEAKLALYGKFHDSAAPDDEARQQATALIGAKLEAGAPSSIDYDEIKREKGINKASRGVVRICLDGVVVGQRPVGSESFDPNTLSADVTLGEAGYIAAPSSKP